MINLAIPHVDVGWATFWLTAAAICIAVYAAIYAKKAFETTEADLKISKDTLERSLRTPKLVVLFEVSRPHEQGGVVTKAGRSVNFSSPILRARVANSDEGKRRCDAFYIEVVVPTAAFSMPEQARMSTERNFGWMRQSRVESTTVLFPGGGAVNVDFLFPLDFPTIPREFVVQYRMKDDFNDYPADGWLETTLRLPTRPQGVFVQPRDQPENRMLEILMKGHPDELEWHKRYIHAANLLDVGGFKPPEQRMQAAEEIAIRVRDLPEALSFGDS
jgi:hypothetical protein